MKIFKKLKSTSILLKEYTNWLGYTNLKSHSFNYSSSKLLIENYNALIKMEAKKYNYLTFLTHLNWYSEENWLKQ
jgi:hypothetical protein